MLKSKYDYTLPSGSPAMSGTATPDVYLLSTSGDAAKGSIVIAGFDDGLDGLDAGKTVGEGSPVRTCQLLSDLTAGEITRYGRHGIFGLVTSDPLESQSFGTVVPDGLELALVQVPNGGLEAWQPLMPDFADDNLEVWDDTTATYKAPALLARDVANSSGSTQVLLVPVFFDGTNGF